MSEVGFEPTIQVFEWAKPVHALDHTDTVIGKTSALLLQNQKRTKHLQVFSTVY
jgi:hypothetical protein